LAAEGRLEHRVWLRWAPPTAMVASDGVRIDWAWGLGGAVQDGLGSKPKGKWGPGGSVVVVCASLGLCL
jgi:hypothetical protein